MKLKQYILLASLGLSLSACDNFLDVPQKGMSIPQTVEDYDLMLNKSYSTGSISNCVMMSPEVSLPENYFSSVSPSNLEGYKWSEHQYLADDNDENWNSFYQQIMVANEIINNIDQAESTTLNETLRAHVKGQAYAERAKSLFGLVNLYAQPYSKAVRDEAGIPIPKENDITQQLGRSTLGEVYDCICNDLRIAEQLVPTSTKNSQKMRASKLALLVFKSKVYLFMNEIDSAYQAIEAAFAISTPQLTPYEQYVTPLTPEEEEMYTAMGMLDIMKYILNKQPFSLPDVEDILWLGNTTDNFRIMATAFYSEELLTLFGEDGKANDYRFKFYGSSIDPMNMEQLPGTRYYNLVKRTFVASQAEMYLLRAECRARKGEYEGAVADLNILRKNRYKSESKYQLSASSASEALKQVKDERLRELAFTGQYWFDLRRYQAYGEEIPTFTRTINGNTHTLEPGSPRYTCAIPRYVINKNTNISQNPR